MSESDRFEKDGYEHHLLSADAPADFYPDRVIHRVLSIDDEHRFIYLRPCLAYAWPQPRFANIDALVSYIDQNGSHGTATDQANLPLGFPVAGPAYVLLELCKRGGWHFDTGRPGITLGKLSEDAWLKSGALRLFNGSEGVPWTEAEGGPAGCRFAYFSALPPEHTKPQALNYNLIDSNGNRFSIDPDIRYPGNGGDVGEGP